MSDNIPPEEIGICEWCKEEYRRKNVGQKFCCNACSAKKEGGSPTYDHSPECQRKGTEEFHNDPQRLFTLESEPGEILWHMQDSWGDRTSHIVTTGAAAMNYKVARLNHEAAEKIARYTKVLAGLTAALVFVGIVNITIELLKWQGWGEADRKGESASLTVKQSPRQDLDMGI